MVEKRGEEGSVETNQGSKEQFLEDTGKNNKNKKNKKTNAKSEQANSKRELSENTTKKIGYLISKSQVREEELYQLVKDFFKDYLKLDYEFTHEELMVELKTVYLEKELLDELESFLKKIAKIECFDNNFSNAEIKTLIEKFEEISKQIMGPLEKQGESSSIVKKVLSSVKDSVKQVVLREKKEEKSKIAQKEESLQALKSKSESDRPVEEKIPEKQKNKPLKRKAKALKKKKASGKVKKSKKSAKTKVKAKVKTKTKVKKLKVKPRPKKKSRVKKTTKKAKKSESSKKLSINKIPLLVNLTETNIQAKDWANAKKYYVELLKIYENSGKKTKHEYYHKIFDLYDQMKN